ncbi:hypothetical protein D3C74_426080 [compost metagenome]
MTSTCETNHCIRGKFGTLRISHMSATSMASLQPADSRMTQSRESKFSLPLSCFTYASNALCRCSETCILAMMSWRVSRSIMLPKPTL